MAVYLKSLKSVRETCARALAAGATFWDVHPEKCAEVAKRVAELAAPQSHIPFHSRWRHFDGDALRAKLAQEHDAMEVARRLLDVVVVSVLLDAGAGAKWAFTTPSGRRVGRSEGLAEAALAMFEAGLFSADKSDLLRVDGEALSALTADELRCAVSGVPVLTCPGLGFR